MMLLGFSAGEVAYGIAVDYVSEVLPALHVDALDAAPPGVLGFFDLRGERLPLFDLKLSKLGEGARTALSTRIIVLDWDGQRVGLLAEHVLELFDAETSKGVSGRAIVVPSDIIPEEICKLQPS